MSEFTISVYLIDLYGDAQAFLAACPWGADGRPVPVATHDPIEAWTFAAAGQAQTIIGARLKDYPLACVRKLTGTYSIDTTEENQL